MFRRLSKATLDSGRSSTHDTNGTSNPPAPPPAPVESLDSLLHGLKSVFAAGNFPLVVTLGKELHAQYPEWATAAIYTGIAVNQLGRYAEAIVMFDGAVAHAEASRDQGLASSALHNRGIAKRNGGNARGAVLDYTAALESPGSDSNRLKLLLDRGLAYRALKHYEAGAADYTDAIALDAGSAEAHYGRSRIRMRLGEVKGQLEDLRCAVDLEPDNPKFAAELHQLVATLPPGMLELAGIAPEDEEDGADGDRLGGLDGIDDDDEDDESASEVKFSTESGMSARSGSRDSRRSASSTMDMQRMSPLRALSATSPVTTRRRRNSVGMDTVRSPSATPRNTAMAAMSSFIHAQAGSSAADTEKLASKVIGEIDTARSLRSVSLDLSQHSLSSLPTRIRHVTSLQSLMLNDNDITSLPLQVAELSSRLTTLSLANNKLVREPPTVLGALRNLTWLDLSHNSLSSVSSQTLGLCENLQHLDLSHNALSVVPPVIAALPSLTTLNLSHNGIASFDADMVISSDEMQLHELALDHNDLSELLDAFIAQCRQLTHLSVAHNALSVLPDGLSRLHRLVRLDASHNDLVTLDNLHFEGMPRLQVALLANNKLRLFPATLCRSKRLTHIDLRNNGLRALPAALSRLVSLKELDVIEGNRIVNVPPSVLQHRHAIKATGKYLRVLSSPVPLHRVRLLIVGDAKAGKTSVARRLRRTVAAAATASGHSIPPLPKTLVDLIPPPLSATAGIDVARFQLPLEGGDGVPPSALVDSWDISSSVGPTSRFFFGDERCVYLVVYRLESSPSALAHLDFKLAGIRSHAKRAPIVLVGTFCDELSAGEVAEAAADVRNKYCTSARYGPGSVSAVFLAGDVTDLGTGGAGGGGADDAPPARRESTGGGGSDRFLPDTETGPGGESVDAGDGDLVRVLRKVVSQRMASLTLSVPRSWLRLTRILLSHGEPEAMRAADALARVSTGGLRERVTKVMATPRRYTKEALRRGGDPDADGITWDDPDLSDIDPVIRTAGSLDMDVVDLDDTFAQRFAVSSGFLLLSELRVAAAKLGIVGADVERVAALAGELGPCVWLPASSKSETVESMLVTSPSRLMQAVGPIFGKAMREAALAKSGLSEECKDQFSAASVSGVIRHGALVAHWESLGIPVDAHPSLVTLLEVNEAAFCLSSPATPFENRETFCPGLLAGSRITKSKGDAASLERHAVAMTGVSVKAVRTIHFDGFVPEGLYGQLLVRLLRLVHRRRSFASALPFNRSAIALVRGTVNTSGSTPPASPRNPPVFAIISVRQDELSLHVRCGGAVEDAVRLMRVVLEILQCTLTRFYRQIPYLQEAYCTHCLRSAKTKDVTIFPLPHIVDAIMAGRDSLTCTAGRKSVEVPIAHVTPELSLHRVNVVPYSELLDLDEEHMLQDGEMAAVVRGFVDVVDEPDDESGTGGGPTRVEVAVKRMRSAEELPPGTQADPVAIFVREARTMAELRHERIVHLVAASLEPMCLATQFELLGDLRSLLNTTREDHGRAGIPVPGVQVPASRGSRIGGSRVVRRTESGGFRPSLLLTHLQIVLLARDVTAALVYLHSLPQALIHRDLKSPNVFVAVEEDDRFAYAMSRGVRAAGKLGDCGSVCLDLPGLVGREVDNPRWLAPEVILDADYGVEADMYSLGVLISEMVTREQPFDAPQYKWEAQLEDAIVAGLRPARPTLVHPSLWELAQRLWTTDPARRPSARRTLAWLDETIVDMRTSDAAFGSADEFDEKHSTPLHRFAPIPYPNAIFTDLVADYTAPSYASVMDEKMRQRRLRAAEAAAARSPSGTDLSPTTPSGLALAAKRSKDPRTVRGVTPDSSPVPSPRVGAEQLVPVVPLSASGRTRLTQRLLQLSLPASADDTGDRSRAHSMVGEEGHASYADFVMHMNKLRTTSFEREEEEAESPRLAASPVRTASTKTKGKAKVRSRSGRRPSADAEPAQVVPQHPLAEEDGEEVVAATPPMSPPTKTKAKKKRTKKVSTVDKE
jgi:Leucine-rich repeat (LRR) protein/serine/threonine protein kinase